MLGATTTEPRQYTNNDNQSGPVQSPSIGTLWCGIQLHLLVNRISSTALAWLPRLARNPPAFAPAPSELHEAVLSVPRSRQVSPCTCPVQRGRLDVRRGLHFPRPEQHSGMSSNAGHKRSRTGVHIGRSCDCSRRGSGRQSACIADSFASLARWPAEGSAVLLRSARLGRVRREMWLCT